MEISLRLAFHADARITAPLERNSKAGFPLRYSSLGSSAGLEIKTTKNASFVLQFDANSTPYRRTGLQAFDKHPGAIILGSNHRFQAGSKQITLQIYTRENMNLPFRVRGNLDPDLEVGLTIVIR